MADNQMNLDAVKEFLNANKDSEEVKALSKQFVSAEAVEEFLGSEDGKKLLQPKLDKHFTKGLDTWKANNLDKIVNDKLNELHPPETPELKKLREMEKKLADMEHEKTQASLKALALQELSAKGIPASMVDYLVGETEEVTRDRITMFEAEYKQAVKQAVEARLKGNGGTPENPEAKGGGTGEMTKADLMNMEYSERLAFYKANPEKYKRIMGE